MQTGFGPAEKAQRFKPKEQRSTQSSSHKVTKLELIVDWDRIAWLMWRQRLLCSCHFVKTVGKGNSSSCRIHFCCGTVGKPTWNVRELVWEGWRKKAGGERVRTRRAAAASRQDRPENQTTWSCTLLKTLTFLEFWCWLFKCSLTIIYAQFDSNKRVACTENI